jgi:hypothetical protein
MAEEVKDMALNAIAQAPLPLEAKHHMLYGANFAAAQDSVDVSSLLESMVISYGHTEEEAKNAVSSVMQKDISSYKPIMLNMMISVINQLDIDDIKKEEKRNLAASLIDPCSTLAELQANLNLMKLQLHGADTMQE